ncbi:MAG: triose-phosphate isomerase [bacterium]|nr:triose-phosphate isomerase [bacterium]
MRKKLIIGNWKMNPRSAEDARKIFAAIKRKAAKISSVTTVICPPFPFLNLLSPDKKVALGAQDIHSEQDGAFTGEVSLAMVANAGGRYVIVGHSERRALGETDEFVNKKLMQALKHGMNSVLCIGEKERDEGGHYLHFLNAELVAALNKIPSTHLRHLVIAYEPIWAIGKKEDEAMKPSEMHEMTIYIRKVLKSLYRGVDVESVPVLYGGSIGESNAEAMIRDGMVDGLLVGRQSLEPEAFGAILALADKTR